MALRHRLVGHSIDVIIGKDVDVQFRIAIRVHRQVAGHVVGVVWTYSLHRAECVRSSRLAALRYLGVLHELLRHHTCAAVVRICRRACRNPGDGMATLNLLLPEVAFPRRTCALVRNGSRACRALICLAACHELPSGREGLPLSNFAADSLLL